MVYEPLNRRLALLAALFALLGVLLGAIALGTNYWTINNTYSNAPSDPTYTTVWNVSACPSAFPTFFYFICRAYFASVTIEVTFVGLNSYREHSSFLSWVLFSSSSVVFYPRSRYTKATNRRFLAPLLIFPRRGFDDSRPRRLCLVVLTQLSFIAFDDHGRCLCLHGPLHFILCRRTLFCCGTRNSTQRWYPFEYTTVFGNKWKRPLNT